MHVLLTNDDGIYAPGIFAAYKELKRYAEVTVVAPDSEKSSVGHGITLAHPLWVKHVHRREEFFGYSVTGTPADCVKLALSVLLKKKPDLVISGINFGDNDGCSVFYSGTVAGAREGALMGIPAMAVSLAAYSDPDFSYAAKCTAELAKIAKKYLKAMPKGTFLNVNVPHKKASQIKGFRVTHQGTTPIHGTFNRRQDPKLKNYYWMSGKLPKHPKKLNVDTDALAAGYVTITPIQSDLTNYSFLDELRSWSPKFVG